MEFKSPGNCHGDSQDSREFSIDFREFSMNSREFQDSGWNWN